MSKEKIFLIGPGIKTEFWLEFYDNVTKTNECEIDIILVGHRRPDFDLPDNFKFVYSSESPTVCAQIAYEKAYELAKETDYIQNTPDDVLYSENHFDKIIKAYKTEEEKDPENDLLMVGPASYNGDERNVMALFTSADHWDQKNRNAAIQRAGGTEEDLGSKLEGPCLLVGNFSTVKTSKALGGINASFDALYWDCDQVLICHSMGGRVVVFEKDQVEPVVERHQSNSRLYAIHGQQDYNRLCNLWDIRSHDGKTWSVTRKEE